MSFQPAGKRGLATFAELSPVTDAIDVIPGGVAEIGGAADTGCGAETRGAVDTGCASETRGAVDTGCASETRGAVDTGCTAEMRGAVVLAVCLRRGVL